MGNENKLKINKKSLEERIKIIRAKKELFEEHRDKATEYVLNREDEFQGATAERFREDFIKLNIITSDVMNILEQYLSSFIGYCDEVKKIDEDAKNDLKNQVFKG